ncbi:hypothetical protein ANANG_G00026350, partial [Anguilla anguilla]
MSDVVVVEVDVLHVGGGLVVAGDVGGDGVLLGEHAQRQRGDEGEGLPPLVAHEAHRALVHHAVQRGQAVVPPVLHAREVVLQVGLQLALLLADVGEVDEEARAHVALQRLHLGGRGRAEPPHQQVAVFEQPAAADLLRAARGDGPAAQVPQRLLEVAVHALAAHAGVEALRHGRGRAAVEQQQRVERDLEGVHAELKLPPQRVHELQLHVLAGVVGQRDEAPAVRVVAHLHQLLHVHLLQGERGNAVPVDPRREEVQQAVQHHVLDQPEGAVVRQAHPEDQVQVLVAQARVLVQHVARSRTVQLHVPNRHAPLLQPRPHHLAQRQRGVRHADTLSHTHTRTQAHLYTHTSSSETAMCCTPRKHGGGVR